MTVVQALDESAAACWRSLGFLPSKEKPLAVVSALADIAASLQSAGEEGC